MRRLLALLACLSLMGAAPVRFTEVRPGVALLFPRDHGAHPDHRPEWWYLTGWLDGPGGTHRGFQITFFRTATGLAGASAFAPRQILFAHAALSDPAIGHLLIGQKIAREGFGLAAASRTDTDVAIDDWRLRRLPDAASSRMSRAKASRSISLFAQPSRCWNRAITVIAARARTRARRAAITACRISRSQAR